MKNKTKRIFQTVGFALAAAFLAYGVSRGEVGIVLTKAVNICLECIGLG